jgi:hypothetical protein
MNTNIVNDLINQTKGRFFRVEFTKADGSHRTMIARTGVSKGVTGVGLSFNPADHNLRTVRDVQKQAFRMIPLDRVTSFSQGSVNWHA